MQPLLLWKSSEYYILWVCVCSLRYPACNVHAPYCHLCPARLYIIFPHYLINGTIFGKKVTENKMCVLIFSTKFEIFLILRRNERDMMKMYIGLHVKYPFFLSNFNETNFLDSFFRKILNSRPERAELFHSDRRTERHETNSHFSQFCELT